MKKSQQKNIQIYQKLLLTGFLVILVYLGLSFLTLSEYTESKQLSFTTDNFKNRETNFYIYEDLSSQKFDLINTLENGEPKILNTPITLTWKPEKFPLDKKITIGAEVSSTFDLEFMVNCKPCDRDIENKTRIFFNKKLYKYPYIKEFRDGYIYSQKEITTTDNTTVDWIKNNLARNKDIGVLNDSINLSEIENRSVEYEENSYSSIQTDLIGTHEFYLYLGKELNLKLMFRNRDFTKINPSEINVALYDLENNKVRLEARSLISLQSVPTDSLTQTFLTKTLPREGVYKLEITIPDTMIIKAVDVNTNKIVLNNHANLSREGSLYSQVNNQREFFIQPKSYNGINDIIITNQTEENKLSEQKVSIDEYDLTSEKEVEIAPGSYKIQSGGAIEFNGLLLAFSSEQFFNPFTYELSAKYTSDVIVTNFSQKRIGDFSEINYILNNEDLYLLKSLKRIEFLIESPQLANRFITDNYAKEKYLLNAITSKYSVLGQKDNLSLPNTKSISHLNIEQLLPKESTILFTTQMPVSQELFISKQANVKVDTSTEVLDLHLLGDHQFYIVTGEKLKVQTEIDPYISDQLFQVQLRNSEGDIVCSENYVGDSSDKLTLLFECNTQLNHIYILTIRSQRQEFADMKGAFEIINMEVNTDKIMIKDRLRSLAPEKYFSNSRVEERLEIFPLSNASNLTIRVSADENFTIAGSEDPDEAKDMIIKTVPKGRKSFNIQQKGVIIKGSNFALHEKNLFNPYSHYVVIDINANPQYIVSDITESDGFYIKEVSLNVE